VWERPARNVTPEEDMRKPQHQSENPGSIRVPIAISISVQREMLRKLTKEECPSQKKRFHSSLGKQKSEWGIGSLYLRQRPIRKGKYTKNSFHF
jgi:hypothetical protein